MIAFLFEKLNCSNFIAENIFNFVRIHKDRKNGVE